MGRKIKHKQCSRLGCKRIVYVRGLCQPCYQKAREYGLLEIRTHYMPKQLPAVVFHEKSAAALGRKLGVSRQRAHQLLNKDAHLARSQVRVAIKNGQLIKPDACERCLIVTPDLEAHHWDYHEPFDIRWLCPPCHSVVHPHSPFIRNPENRPIRLPLKIEVGQIFHRKRKGSSRYIVIVQILDDGRAQCANCHPDGSRTFRGYVTKIKPATLQETFKLTNNKVAA